MPKTRRRLERVVQDYINSVRRVIATHHSLGDQDLAVLDLVKGEVAERVLEEALQSLWGLRWRHLGIHHELGEFGLCSHCGRMGLMMFVMMKGSRAEYLVVCPDLLAFQFKLNPRSNLPERSPLSKDETRLAKLIFGERGQRAPASAKRIRIVRGGLPSLGKSR